MRDASYSIGTASQTDDGLTSRLRVRFSWIFDVLNNKVTSSLLLATCTRNRGRYFHRTVPQVVLYYIYTCANLHAVCVWINRRVFGVERSERGPSLLAISTGSYLFMGLGFVGGGGRRSFAPTDQGFVPKRGDMCFDVLPTPSPWREEADGRPSDPSFICSSPCTAPKGKGHNKLAYDGNDVVDDVG
jgi:hypothetical protein